MTKSDYSTPNTEPVSAITKHVKIYSDNPIHDAIDRIINSCACIDEDDDYCHMASLELQEAASDLLILANDRITNIKSKYQRGMNEQKLNQ